ncbi:MAG: YbhB/YbcL family Raf kinase inhibitor-like protein [Ilumatobacteraceae bacterium]
MRPHVVLAPVIITCLAVVTAGCVRSDGRTLRDPVFPPPATVVTGSTVPQVDRLPTETAPPVEFQLLAPWQDGAEIPVRFTCDGDALSPPLSWSGIPDGTTELAITVVDLDLDGAAHWILYAMSPTTSNLVEGITPDDALSWTNDFGSADWEPLCPPVGTTHRYQFSVHALNQQLEVAEDASAAEVIDTLDLVAIDQGSVTGTVTRTG